jgi:hypothetical protein
VDHQHLVDHQAIVDLTHTYCWALDSHRWDDLDAVFLPDATAVLGSAAPLQGLGAIKQRIASALGPLDDSQHMVNTHQIHVTADTATSRCYLHAQHVRHAAADQGTLGPNFVVAGRYEDRLVRTADGWRIAHRDLITMWTAGNVAVVRGS